ncbi:MAG TPA: hypothetical protein PLW22_11150 [Tenuifilum sp.]|uniref:hypothetical protein n=1 Tax=Tenuifilum sp. TaxID=2760880 RepID=UPI002C40CEBC|nr:hypothetical protein [Tenuifilum sp.]
MSALINNNRGIVVFNVVKNSDGSENSKRIRNATTNDTAQIKISIRKIIHRGVFFGGIIFFFKVKNYLRFKKQEMKNICKNSYLYAQIE